MRPSLGCSKPAIRRRVVVLPQPEGARREKNSRSDLEVRVVHATWRESLDDVFRPDHWADDGLDGWSSSVSYWEGDWPICTFPPVDNAPGGGARALPGMQRKGLPCQQVPYTFGALNVTARGPIAKPASAANRQAGARATRFGRRRCNAFSSDPSSARLLNGRRRSSVRRGLLRFKNGTYPIYLSHGKGSRVWDQDCHGYRDFHAGSARWWWAQRHPRIVEAVPEGQRRGTHFAVTPRKRWPTAKSVSPVQLRDDPFANSGTEATMDASVRALRQAGRDLQD